jgi:hypothetical protein
VFGNAPQTYAPGDPAAIARIRAAVDHAAEIGQPFWVLAGRLWLALDAGWRQDPVAAIAPLRAEVERQADMGQTIALGYAMARLGEICARAGLMDEARRRIAAAEAEVAHGRCGLHAPEVLRLKAEVLLRGSPAEAAAALPVLEAADALAAEAGLVAWRWLIAASRARAEAAAADRLEAALDALAMPGCEAHPAWRQARATLDALRGAPALAGAPPS